MDGSIAIVGMSCRFAGCSTPAALWETILNRQSRLTVLGPDAELPFGQSSIFGNPYPVRLGQLGELYSCIPSMQNFPRQVNAGENQDLYFATQLAFDALADASIRPHSREQIRGSVRLGYAPPFNASTVNWLQHTAFLDQTLDVVRHFFPHAPEERMQGLREQLVESLPAPNAASFLLGSGYRFVSWIARECSFSGAATIMDAGMLTGAAILQDAMDDLVERHVDVALAGAITPPLSRAYLEGLSGEVPFSTKTELRPFSSDADGTIPGEGGAFFVLKRHEDALSDHDRIYAVIRRIALGHSPDDDPTRILAEATERANVPVKTIGLVEADGSGVGPAERREIETLQKLWGEHRPGGALVGVGSVKGNIGHTLHASMAAGIVKAALALYHKVLPPQVVPEHPLETLSSTESSVYLATEPRPWLVGRAVNPRRAAVLGANFDPIAPIGTSFAGGRAAAIILEEESEGRG